MKTNKSGQLPIVVQRRRSGVTRVSRIGAPSPLTRAASQRRMGIRDQRMRMRSRLGVTPRLSVTDGPHNIGHLCLCSSLFLCFGKCDRTQRMNTNLFWEIYLKNRKQQKHLQSICCKRYAF